MSTKQLLHFSNSVEIKYVLMSFSTLFFQVFCNFVVD